MVIINGLAAVSFMIGYVLLGVAMIRTVTLPRWSGVLVAVGAPAHLLGFGIAQLVTTAAWPIAILGSVCLGAGLGWAGYRPWQTPTASDVVASDRTTAPYEHRICEETRRETTGHCTPRTGDHLSGGRHTRRFSCGGLVLMASAHWVLLQPDQEFRLDRFMEPTLNLASGATSAELLRWAAVLDLSAYSARHRGPGVRVVAAAAAA